VTTQNPTNTTENQKAFSYKYWAIIALFVWLAFFNGWSSVQYAMGDFSIKDAAKQTIRGVDVLMGDSSTVSITDSSGNQIEIPNLDDVNIPDLISDPSTSSVSAPDSSQSTDDNLPAVDINTITTAVPTVVQATSAGGSMNGNAVYHGKLPDAVITNRSSSDQVVPRGLPDAAKMPTASPYPTWPARTPIATSEYSFVNLSKPGSPYYCVQVSSLGTQSCTADPYIVDNALAQDDLARYLLTGLIQGEPIGTTPH
jgi:hypothetical protein